MKLTPRGFTLVELMIVIAIIGILAAALFPSLTAYLARGRDTSRAAGLKEISTAVAAYQVDQTKMPATANSVTSPAADCASGTVLAKQLPKFPKDPIATRTNSCGTQGAYGYGTGSMNGTDAPVFSAAFENPTGGNTGGVVTAFQGNGIVAGTMTSIDTLQKGYGSGYVIRN